MGPEIEETESDEPTPMRPDPMKEENEGYVPWWFGLIAIIVSAVLVALMLLACPNL